jgi:hypothetical protein
MSEQITNFDPILRLFSDGGGPGHGCQPLRMKEALDSPVLCGTSISLSTRPHQFELTGVKASPKAPLELANTYLPASLSFVMESQREVCGSGQHV